MHLVEVKDLLSLDPSLSAEIITSAEVKKIFYLITGRNAWHSTWSSYYYKKCIATESRDLENDAEKMRGPGTTFQIDEIPALCLGLHSGCLVITEVNTIEPLKSFRPNSAPTDAFDLALNNLSKKSTLVGDSVGHMLRSLNSQECWAFPKQARSLFQLFAKGLQSSDFEEATRNYLTRVSGPSGGRKNSLSWSIKKGNRSDEFIKSLASSNV